MTAHAEHPGEHHARVRIGRAEHPLAAVLVVARAIACEHFAVAPEVALDLPRDALREHNLRDPLLIAELPLSAIRVAARIEVRRSPEVVLRLRRVGDAPADAREPEHTDRLALVGVTQEVELAALEEQVVRVDAARRDLVALHRVVVEGDRLVAEDRGLDLRESRRELLPSGRCCDAERDRGLAGRLQWARPAPRDLLQREPQRLGVGELPVEELQRGLERRELLVRELDRR